MRVAAAAGTLVWFALVLTAPQISAQEIRGEPLAPLVTRLGATPLAHAPLTRGLVPSLAFAQIEDEQRTKRRTLGLRGALIGAAVGAAAGAVLVRGFCDVPNCRSHPDTRRIMLGSIGIGAVLGFTVDAVIISNRRAVRVRLRPGAS